MIPQPKQKGEVRRETDLAPPQPAGERLRHAWRLLACYWTSRHWKFAWFALVVLVVLQFGGTYVALALNRWERNFFDSIQNRDLARFGVLLTVFMGVLALHIVTIVLERFMERLLSIRWRSYLTERYVDRWMSNNRYTEIERLRIIDNPDQRIAEDLNLITDMTRNNLLSIALTLLGTIATAIAMVYVLMETANPIRFSLFGTAISIPGGTIWYALIYSAVTTYAMVLLGKPFIRAQMRQQHREADFRSDLIHVRRNAPQIGLAQAVPIERGGLHAAFTAVRRNYYTVIGTTVVLSAATTTFLAMREVVPLLLFVPSFFAGTITLGQLMANRDAFGRLVGNFSLFMTSYPNIAQQISYINRVKALDDALDDPRPRGIALDVGSEPDIAIATTAMALRKPDGEPLTEVGDWAVRSGERWAIRGPSGAGKSTLVRALAGLWPDGAGRVAVAADTRTMFVPQRLYLPLGTLKAGLCFPDPADAHDDATIVALLERVRLGHLVPDLHAARMWQEELSPGEQQRVALARILLQRPTLLVLDEATSALDPDNARHFYASVGETIPDATILSVVHDESLLRFHTHTLTIVDGSARAERIPEDGR